MAKLSMARFKFVSIALGLYALGLTAADYGSLMRREFRPTMADVAESLPSIPDLNSSLRNQRGSQTSTFVRLLIQGGPTLIANLEKAFPGATWAFLGRDTQLIADLVESFYLSIGQKGRVVRVGMSKPTLASLTDASLLTRYLEGLGLSVETIDSAPPFIFVDTISQGYGRQARTLVSHFYEHYEEKTGSEPARLLRKVNIIGLVVSTFQGSRHDLAGLPALLAEEEARYLAAGSVDFFNEHKIPTFPEPVNLFNETGYEHYTGAWHGPFGSLVAEGGAVRSTPGEAQPATMRTQILSSQAAIWAAVSAPDFLNQVKEKAKALGYEFPVQPPARVQAKAMAMALAPPPELPPHLKKLAERGQQLDQEFKAGFFAFHSELAELVKSFEKPTSKTESPSEMTLSGLTLHAWYRAHLRGGGSKTVLSFEMMKALRAGRKGLRLRSEDLKVIAADIFAHTEPHGFLVAEVKAFMKEAKAFNDMMTFEDWIVDRPGYETYKGIKTWLKEGLTCANLLAAP